jgi:hypothetical protein
MLSALGRLNDSFASHSQRRQYTGIFLSDIVRTAHHRPLDFTTLLHTAQLFAFSKNNYDITLNKSVTLTAIIIIIIIIIVIGVRGGAVG